MTHIHGEVDRELFWVNVYLTRLSMNPIMSIDLCALYLDTRPPSTIHPDG